VAVPSFPLLYLTRAACQPRRRSFVSFHHLSLIPQLDHHPALTIHHEFMAPWSPTGVHNALSISYNHSVAHLP
jgi:hypothetical protein